MNLSIKVPLTFIFLRLVDKSSLWLSFGCVYHSSHSSIQGYTILCWQRALAAATQYSYTAAVVDELTGLYVVNVVVKKRRTIALFCLRDAHCKPPQQCLSSSQYIHMVGLYSSLRPLTYRAPVGIQFCCNHDGWIPPPHTPHYPLHALIIIVTLEARFGPVGPKSSPRRTSPGNTQLQLAQFIVMYACMIPVIFLHAFQILFMTV